MSLIVDEHRKYLSDPVRLDAFRRAIAEIVSPGAVVLDLASGTGILGLFACEAGAARVYSIELNGMVEISRAVAAANGLSGRVIALHGFSSQVRLPESVDAIICDQLSHFGIEANIIADASDVRRRFLKPGGAMLPTRIDLMLAPIEGPELFDQVQFWGRRPAGFDFSPARQWAANTGYPTLLAPEALLGPPRTLYAVDMLTAVPQPFVVSGELTVGRAGTLHGIGGWFSAQLSPNVTLTNGPTTARRLGRRNVFFPIDRAVPVEPGDIVAVNMHIVPPTAISWSVEIRRGGQSLGRFRHSTLNGMLLSRDDLRRMKPDFVPSLTDRGVARQSVLELCDGKRRLADIEREVYARHASLFSSVADAGAFVAEVVSRYSR